MIIEQRADAGVPERIDERLRTERHEQIGPLACVDPVKPGGLTPTIVTAAWLMRICAPTAEGLLRIAAPTGRR